MKAPRRNQTKTIKFDYDMTEFEENCKKVIKDIQTDELPVLKRMATKFAEGASKETQPDRGRNSISKKYWTRPVLSLGKLIRNYYSNFKPIKEDYEAYRNKFKYKVVNTKSGVPKNASFAYCKTLAQAKKASKISTRGLSRVMWGKNLDDIGSDVPSSISRILEKSPVLKNINENSVKLLRESDENAVEIVNSVKSIENYAKYAEQAGYRKVINVLNNDLRKIADKNKKL